MGTTGKMGIPYPENTGYVTDGAADMQSLAEEVDTKTGLVLIDSNTLTNAATIGLEGFSADFNAYRIVGSVTTLTGTPNMVFQLKNGASVASGANYERQRLSATSTTVSAAQVTGETSARLNLATAAGLHSFVIDIFDPFEASPTYWLCNNFGSGYPNLTLLSGTHTLSTSYSGIQFLASSGNVTGYVNVYGYNQ